MEELTPETSPIGYAWGSCRLSHWCRAVYGGVAWPGKGPGFVVVLGMAHGQRFGSHDVWLLDEAESADTRELVRRIGVFHDRYEPKAWIGDTHDSAGDRFFRELNEERARPPRNVPPDLAPDRRIYLTRPSLFDAESPYSYFLPELRRLLDKERRQLYLKNSAVLGYLGDIKPDEMPFMSWGDSPAVEAVALTAIELRSRETYRPAPPRRAKRDVLRRRRFRR